MTRMTKFLKTYFKQILIAAGFTVLILYRVYENVIMQNEISDLRNDIKKIQTENSETKNYIEQLKRERRELDNLPVVPGF